jgi:hypothetical protein
MWGASRELVVFLIKGAIMVLTVTNEEFIRMKTVVMDRDKEEALRPCPNVRSDLMKAKNGFSHNPLKSKKKKTIKTYTLPFAGRLRL